MSLLNRFKQMNGLERACLIATILFWVSLVFFSASMVWAIWRNT